MHHLPIRQMLIESMTMILMDQIDLARTDDTSLLQSGVAYAEAVVSHVDADVQTKTP
jgi:hypothetical protein